MKRITNQFLQWSVLSGFVFIMVFTIYLGANFYQSMSKESEHSMNQRTIVLYFNHRFNQSDVRGKLFIYDDYIVINHDGYFTLIYEEDGFLVEQVSEVDYKLEMAGQKIAEIDNLEFNGNHDVIQVKYEDKMNMNYELNYTLKSRSDIQ
jgi:hypothetical protein